MGFLSELWLPILVSSVFVFLISSLLHMLIPIHKGDYKKLPGEEQILRTMREQDVKPGEYMFPCASCMSDMGSPEMLAKFNKGPIGFMAVMPSGPWTIGKSLVQWFLYALLISFFTAYIAQISLEAGAEFTPTFRITGTVAVLAYATAYIPNSIWKGVPCRTTIKYIFDGIVYGLVTGATFGWLWP